jgi:hypothetical protein
MDKEVRHRRYLCICCGFECSICKPSSNNPLMCSVCEEYAIKCDDDFKRREQEYEMQLGKPVKKGR